MMKRIDVPVFAITLFLSAALLFSIQPLFSRMLLPLLGGSPQVWNTAMLFFQVMLLAGYAYAHGSARYMPPRAQGVVHLILMALFLAVLPLALPADWPPPDREDPTLWQLGVMTLSVGGPFFMLAASAPLFQYWFARTDHKDADNPYFLYSASNMGSMLALLAYPVVIEPYLKLGQQSSLWAAGYMLLMALTVGCFALSGKRRAPVTAAGEAPAVPITWRRRLLWLVLSAIPSSLMLGVTTYITTDLAAVPLLWVLPLALYVGTFIIAFAKRDLIPYKYLVAAQGILIAALIGFQMLPTKVLAFSPILLVGPHLLIFFVCALTCHTDLVKTRPPARQLTEFYLMIALGGAIGGVFNAIFAPQYLINPIEYTLALLACIAMRYCREDSASLKALWGNIKQRVKTQKFDVVFSRAFFLPLAVAMVCFLGSIRPDTNFDFAFAALAFVILLTAFRTRLLFFLLCLICFSLMPVNKNYQLGEGHEVILQDRSFFGVLRVVESKGSQTRALVHGTTNHGVQSVDDRYRLSRLSYYSRLSPFQDVFDRLGQRKNPTQKIAVIGLGIGSLACFTHEGRSFNFYEIDPHVAQIAEDPEMFTFLADCGSPYKIILGDGRLKIAQQPEQTYDAIFLDAFSSDNIPIHLLTLEAAQTYRKTIKRGGILVFHISNNYLSLHPIVANAAHELGLTALSKITEYEELPDEPHPAFGAHVMVMTDNAEDTAYFVEHGWSIATPDPGITTWTDDFSNILSVIGKPSKNPYENSDLKNEDEKTAP